MDYRCPLLHHLFEVGLLTLSGESLLFYSSWYEYPLYSVTEKDGMRHDVVKISLVEIL